MNVIEGRYDVAELLLRLKLPHFALFAKYTAAVPTPLCPRFVIADIFVPVRLPSAGARFLYPSILVACAHLLPLSELECRTHYTPPSCTCRWASMKFSMSCGRKRRTARFLPKRTTGIRGFRRVA